MGISKYSNTMKAFCLDNGLVDYLRDRYKEAYRAYKISDLSMISNLLQEIDSHNDLDCSNRLLESKYRRYARAREHIGDLVSSGKAIFITLTFTDEVLNNTSAQTRRKYVARYLKSQCLSYVANIDYSPTKQREHYHAVVSNRCDMTKWRYGFVWVERIRTQDFNCNRVARYVSKLTSHAFKVGCNHLLYSRDTL